MSNVINGYAAIDYAETRPEAVLCKYADPIEDARESLTLDEAREIASEAPGLIFVVAAA